MTIMLSYADHSTTFRSKLLAQELLRVYLGLPRSVLEIPTAW